MKTDVYQAIGGNRVAPSVDACLSYLLEAAHKKIPAVHEKLRNYRIVNMLDMRVEKSTCTMTALRYLLSSLLSDCENEDTQVGTDFVCDLDKRLYDVIQKSTEIRHESE
jgi:hypothetical protein